MLRGEPAHERARQIFFGGKRALAVRWAVPHFGGVGAKEQRHRGDAVAIDDGEVQRDVDCVVEDYIPYVERGLRKGVPLNAMTRPILGLFNGRPGARLFRRHLSENATRRGADLQTLREALAHLARQPVDAAAA